MSDEKFLLKKLEKKNMKEILDIENECFSTPWSEDMFLGEFKKDYSEIYGIFDQKNKLAGYIIYWLIEDEIHLVNLAVKSEYRRMGAASLMMEYMINYALENGYFYIFLEVRLTNIPAIELYHSFGFILVGRRPKYYPDNGEDALLYTLLLEDYRFEK